STLTAEKPATVEDRTITTDPQTGKIIVIGPTSYVPITDFPAVVKLAVYGHVTGAHGTYPLTFDLQAADGDVVWQCRPSHPLHQADPLAPTQLVFEELRVSVDRPGRYDLALRAGEDEIARQPLLIGPAEAL
ncbi:MAG: DUF6941 family protein, partial [Planctomycetia bacterium]